MKLSIFMCVILVYLLQLLSTQAYAASSGIKSNEQDECSIWLCLPGGFATGCGAAKSAFLNRVLDLDKKGRPKWTPLPDIARCIKTDPNEAKVGTAGDASEMTYQNIPNAFIPEHKICTEFKTFKYCTGGTSSNPYVCYTKRKCVGWQTIPEKYVKGSYCRKGAYTYDDFGQVIGSKSSPEWCTKTVNETTVYGDGQKYGNSWYW